MSAETRTPPVPVAGPAPAIRVAGGGFLRSELRTLFGRRRTWAMLLALAAVPVLIGLAVHWSSSPPQPGEGPPFLDRVTHNGLFVAVTALVVAMPLFLPLTVGVVAGDTVAGEAGTGTLRYLLVAPLGRVRLLAIKLVAALAFCLAATLTVGAVGAAVGAALFPVGPVALLSGSTVGAGESLVRIALVALYVAVSLAGLTAVGLFVSTLTQVPVGAMAATVVVAVASQVLGAIPQIDWLHPWLLSHHWQGFGDLLRDPIRWASFADNLLLQGGYLAVFGALAYARFTTKDVLS